MLRTTSELEPATEALIHQIIGCCITVHRALGPGLLEKVYSRAICIELACARVPFEREKHVGILYREQLLCYHSLDIVVADQILLEIKAVDRLAPVHQAQVLGYLRAARLRVGLLLNFNVPVLAEGLKRIVL